MNSYGRRATARLAAALCLLLVACAGEEAPAPPADEAATAPAATPKVLLIGIDGVRPDMLAEVETPNIDALAADGLLIDDARTTTPSVSGPAWSSMLTGVWPEKHGVIDNGFEGKRYDLYPDFLTRVEQVRPELRTVAAADWLPLVSVEEGLETVSDAVDVKHFVDGYELGWAEADERVAAFGVEELSESDPDAIFVYLGNPDETSHEHGSIGAEYREAIALADAHLGRLVEATRTRPTFSEESWLVLVSTDHGRRADGGHGGDSAEEMTMFVLLSGSAAEGLTAPDEAYIVDVAATALAHLGIELDPEWALDGRSLLHR